MHNSGPVRPSFTVVNPNNIVIAMSAVLLMEIGGYFFIKYAIFTDIATIFFVTIASKTSETTLLLDIQHFQTLSYVSISVTAALLFAVLLLIRFGKSFWAAAVALITLTLAGFYMAVMLGNGFHELWGGAWSALGIGLAVIITLALDFLIITSLRIQKPRA